MPLSDLGPFSGGLDTAHGADGEFALVWTGGGALVLFHTPLLMPQGLNNRKRHVGNDFVHVVFAEPGVEYDVGTISGSFGLVTIIVTPYTTTTMCKVECNIVGPRTGKGAVKGVDERLSSLAATLAHLVGVTVLPWDLVPNAVRQLAIKADLACRVLFEDQMAGVSNWESRVIQIDRIGHGYKT